MLKQIFTSKMLIEITRYGRDDEELLGLRFCNEVVVAADQIHPPPDREDPKKDPKATVESNKSDEEIENVPIQKAAPTRSTRNTRTSGTTTRGRYGSVAGFGGKNQPLTQSSIISAFSKQSQNLSSKSSKKSILYDSDSD